MTIKEIRRELAWTQKRMATEMEVGLSSLRRYEAHPELTPPSMMKLARLLLGVDHLKRWVME